MAKNNLLKGNSPDIISANVRTLKNAGYAHNKALRCAMCHANKKSEAHNKKVAAKVVKNNFMQVKVK